MFCSEGEREMHNPKTNRKGTSGEKRSYIAGREEVGKLSEKQDEEQFVLVFILQRKCLIIN